MGLITTPGHHRGVCPKCQGKELDYWGEGEYIKKPWAKGKSVKEFIVADYTCKSCEFKGREWYLTLCNAETGDRKMVLKHHTDAEGNPM